MKKTNKLLNLGLSLSLLLGGVSLIATQNHTFKKALATQHLENFADYTYSGTYYSTGVNFNGTGGMYGTLRTDLTTKIKPAGFYSYYSAGQNHLSTQLQYADEDPTNSDNMIYFYTRESVPKNPATTWNREHVWCQSLSNDNWGTEEGGTDILHLRPTYNDVNSSRNNRPYADNGKGTEKIYEGKLFGYAAKNDNYTYFEPLDSVKGDVARIIMYLWTAYTGYVGKKTYQPLTITDVIKDFDTLLRWHTMDKPDVLEGNRNNYCEGSIQGNRNPFVDHPEFAWRIFGDEASESVKTACMTAYPASGFTPVQPTAISLDKTVVNMDVGDAVQLNPTFTPSGSYAQINWTSTNAAVASVTSGGLVTAHKTGSCTIYATINDDIHAECSVSVTNNNTIVKANSVEAGDIVYLTSDDVKKQYNGQSDNGKFGLGVSYQNKPYSNGPSFDVLDGTQYGTYTFKLRTNDNSNKYLSWTSENSLRLTETTSVNTSWNLDFDGDGNVLISNAADSAREIWWNDTDPRFSCYTGKTENNQYKKTQLWKIDIDAYLESSTVLPTIHGSERNTLVQYQRVASFSQGSGEFTSKTEGPITITYVGGGVAPTYNNNALTVNKDNVFTITSTYDLASAQFTYANSVADDYTFTPNASHGSGYWFVKGKNVQMLVNSDQLSISSIRFAYNKPETLVDDMYMRFGATISKNTWDSISQFHQIEDYGVKFVKLSTLQNTYKVSSVKEAVENNLTVATYSKGDGVAPTLRGNKYSFNVRIDVTTSTKSTKIVAAPFIQADGKFYFLEEMTYSYNTLAYYYLNNPGSELSNDALRGILGY